MDQEQRQKGRLDGVLSLYLVVTAPRLLKYTIPKLLHLGLSCLRQTNSCFFSGSFFFFFFFWLSLIFFLCLMRLKLFSCLCGKYNYNINVKRKISLCLYIRNIFIWSWRHSFCLGNRPFRKLSTQDNLR